LAAYRTDLKQLHRFVRKANVQAWEDLTPEVLECFVEALQDREYRSSTVARKVATARSFLNFLFAEGVVTQELADRMHIPKVGKRLPRTLSHQDVKRLLKAASLEATPLSLRDRAILELLYATGLRASELVQLQVRDLDLEKRTVRCMGKGNKERVVPVHGAACEHFRQYLEEGRPFLLRDAVERTLFVNNLGQPLTRQGLWFLVQHYAHAAGLGDWVTPHTLRHTFATHLLDGGAELREVQQFLGHANITTTQIYTEVSQRRKRQAYDAAHPRAHMPGATEPSDGA
jgi:integrase/recombinase XerD